MKKKISFILNGEKREANVWPNQILLNFLREEIGIKSPKSGCERGDCGSCTVLINNQSVKSCLVLAVEIDEQSVTTIEGLMKEGELSQLQKSFLKNNSFQCGFCAPGMIISSHELLEEKTNPTTNDIKEAISGNLCRCTGYLPIIDAIKDLSLEDRTSHE